MATPNIPDFNQWIDPPIDYEVDRNSNSSFSLNKAYRQKNLERKARFNKLQSTSIRARNRAAFNARRGATRSGFQGAMSATSSVIQMGRFASRAFVPIAIMATSLEIGKKFVDYSFDRTELQGDIASVTDLFVSETPMLLSAVAFGAVENKISGKFSGSAGSFMSKRFGGGGGLKGKAVSMAAGVVTYALSTELMKPIQESLGRYISGERSAGVMASVVKGFNSPDEETPEQAEATSRRQAKAKSQAEATIRRQAKAQGLTTEFEIQKYAKSLKLPSSMRELNTKQIQQAKRELTETLKETEGGFWNALLSGNVNKWTEEKQNRQGLEDIKKELKDREVELYEEISLNNAAIIDFYSRE